MLVTAVEAAAAAQPRAVAGRARRRDRQHRRAQRRRQDQPGRGALLRPHRPLVPDLRPPRPDPLRRPRWPGPRRRSATTTGSSARLLASVSRTEGRRHLLDGSRGRPGDAGPQPAAGRGLRPGPARPGQGPAGRAPRPPRRLHRRPLAGARGAAQAIRPGAGPAQRPARPDPAAATAAPTELDVWDAGSPTAAAPLIAAAPRRSPSWPAVRRPPPPSSAWRAERTLEYAPRAAGRCRRRSAPGSSERREHDIRLGRSSWGPHLDELRLDFDGRPLRRYGSQGQQRAGLLALLFAEREALLAARRVDAAAAARRRDERARPRAAASASVAAPRRRRPGADHRRRRGVAVPAADDLSGDRVSDRRLAGAGAEAAGRSGGGVSRAPRSPARPSAALRAARDPVAPKTGSGRGPAAWAGGRRRAHRRRRPPVSESATGR